MQSGSDELTAVMPQIQKQSNGLTVGCMPLYFRQHRWHRYHNIEAGQQKTSPSLEGMLEISLYFPQLIGK